MALLLVALGIPMWRRKVRPNLWYGFRTPTTLADERIWYDVNARAGADMIASGLVLAVLAPALGALCDSPEAAVLGCAVWLIASSVFMVVHGFARIGELGRMR